ncbi:MAG TPA: PDZ domain-containing protein [Verrucomicrobiales bacterium]|nr:PDZ domain-containing protein [Verrucomicrobiales bacterium]
MSFRHFVIAVFTGLLIPALASAQDAAPDKSMVRVNITSQAYNFGLPWQKQNPGTRRGLGALLPGNRVLVTAELAQDASYVELEIASSGRKLVSKVEAVDYEINLATIVPAADPGDFFNGMTPLQIDSKLKPKATISVWQFENNGEPVTSPLELNRVDIGGYFLEEQFFLIFQANGAVQYRAGTFTLPVVHDGKLAGMLIRYNSRDQVADIIPPQMIDRFLTDVSKVPYDGVPNFGSKTSQTLDPQLRKYLKLDGIEGGILITSVTPGFSAEQAGVKEGDVLLEINGNKLDSRGYYSDKELGLLASSHLLRGAARVGDVVKLKIFRDGKAIDIDCKMLRRNPSDYLVDPYMFDRGPRYLILGGLLFQELTLNYLQLAGREWRDRAPFRLLYAQTNQDELMKQGRKKLVFLSGVLPSPGTIGYERLRQLIVTKVNDKSINDIKDLAEALKSPIEGIHKVEFADFPRLIHMDAAQAEQDNKEFLPNRYRINKMQRLE